MLAADTTRARPGAADRKWRAFSARTVQTLRGHDSYRLE
jgi:hypothetical protein